MRVRDTGIGIAPEMLPRVFDLFIQVEPPLDRVQGGLGIGLTLVTSLVEMHGGTVEAHSEGPGRGSEFVVRLPALARLQDRAGQRARPEAAGAARPAPAPHPGGGRQRGRRRQPGPAAAAGGPRGAGGPRRRRGRRRRPQAFRPEVGPPGHRPAGHGRLRGGPAAAAASRSLEDTLLVALTGWGQEEDRQRSQEAGFDHHLVKPVEPDALHRLLAGPCVRRSTY